MPSAATRRMKKKVTFCPRHSAPTSARHNVSSRLTRRDENLVRETTPRRAERFWCTRDAVLRTDPDVRRGERGVVDEVDNLVSKSAENPR